MWFIVFVVVFLLSLDHVSAGSLSVSGVPEAVDATSAFEVQYSYVCAGCEKKANYFFAALKANDSNRYFGLNEVGGQWINYETEKNALLYSLSSPSEEGTWSGTLSIKPVIADSISEHFKGAGNYILKIFRFTPSSSSDSIETPIDLTYTPPPTPTPTPMPTPVPTPVPTPLPTPRPTISNTPTPTPKPTTVPTTPPFPPPTPIPTVVLTISPTPLPTIEIATYSALLVDEPDQISSVAGATTVEIADPPGRLVPILISLGGVCMMAGLLPAGWKLVKEMNVEK